LYTNLLISTFLTPKTKKNKVPSYFFPLALPLPLPFVGVATFLFFGAGLFALVVLPLALPLALLAVVLPLALPLALPLPFAGEGEALLPLAGERDVVFLGLLLEGERLGDFFVAGLFDLEVLLPLPLALPFAGEGEGEGEGDLERDFEGDLDVEVERDGLFERVLFLPRVSFSLSLSEASDFFRF